MAELEYRPYPAPPDTAHAVRAIWTLRGRAYVGVVEPIVSDACPEIVFNAGDPWLQLHADGTVSLQPTAMLVGPTARPTFVEPGRDVNVLGVRLHPWGLSSLVGIEVAELKDLLIPLDVVSARLSRLADEVLDAMTRSEPIGPVSAALGRALAPPTSLTTPTTRRLVEVASSARETPTVRGLAARFGMSTRGVQRAFRHHVGLSATTLFRIARVQRALRLAEAHPEQPWSRIGAMAGYYDQPHLVREFRALVGRLPSEHRPDDASLTSTFVDATSRHEVR
jgi:AraC-like DNA-binding protein